LLSTVIALIGPDAGPAARQAAAASNVSYVETGELAEDVPGAMADLADAWARAGRRHGIFTLLDADPLTPLVAEWAARLRGAANELELAIGLAGGSRLPDYYLVSPDLGSPEIDWYLSHLRGLAPTRVEPVTLSGPAVLAALESLSYGAGFPPAAEVAASARTFVPLPQVQPVAAPVSGLVRI
jgi:hypothetical protein